MEIVLSILTALAYFLFPIWVAVHAWRKNFRALSVVIGISFLIPFLPAIIALVALFIVQPYHPNLEYIPNPRLFIGWGTKFYCATERSNDSSFLTTQWFTFFYIPVIPVQSYRIIRGASDYKWHGYTATSTTYFQVLECKRLQMNHIIKVIGLMLSYIILIVLMTLFAKNTTGPGPSAAGADTTVSAILGLTVVYLVAGYFLLRAK